MKTAMNPQKLLSLRNMNFLSDYFFGMKIDLHNSSSDWTCFALLYHSFHKYVLTSDMKF